MRERERKRVLPKERNLKRRTDKLLRAEGVTKILGKELPLVGNT